MVVAVLVASRESVPSLPLKVVTKKMMKSKSLLLHIHLTPHLVAFVPRLHTYQPKSTCMNLCMNKNQRCPNLKRNGFL
jgi:hypothetical protein